MTPTHAHSFFVLFYLSCICRSLIGFAFPAFSTVKVLKSVDVEDEPIQWMCYWIIFAVFYICECLLLARVASIIPFYNEVVMPPPTAPLSSNVFSFMWPWTFDALQCFNLRLWGLIPFPFECKIKVLGFLWLQLPQFQVPLRCLSHSSSAFILIYWWGQEEK